MFNQPVVKILCSILRIAILVGAQSSEMTPTELIHWKGADSQVLSSDDCSFNSTNMNSVYVESSNQCGSECFKRNTCTHFTWKDGDCKLMKISIENGENKKPIKKFKSNCGFIQSRVKKPFPDSFQRTWYFQYTIIL